MPIKNVTDPFFRPYNNRAIYWSSLLVAVIIGVGIGISIGAKRSHQASAFSPRPAIRLGGRKFISPLLIGDADTKQNSPNLNPLQAKLTEFVEAEVDKNNLSDASIYFRELNTQLQTNVNSNQKYYPASLYKVLIMIAYMNQAQANPDVLTKNITITDKTDANAAQLIKPAQSVGVGKSYSAQDLIQFMIKYSDNNAANALVNNIDPKELSLVAEDMHVTLPYPQGSAVDIIGPGDFSLFLRILYNSTYLNEKLSESALQILSDTTFDTGIVAGIPAGITVSHKYGLEEFINDSARNTDVKTYQLHDCGIVYYPQAPYLLCVMTKSAAQLEQTEQVIKGISALVYADVTARNK